MRLVSFSVTNFRSITKAHKIALSDLTVVVGKNNEGKSNALKALNVAMNALLDHSSNRGNRFRHPIRSNMDREENYYWERDFPISLQTRAKGLSSIFRLDFELTDEEVDEFKDEVKSSINNTLPLDIRIGPKGQPDIKIAKRGRWQATLSNKSEKIAKFVGRRTRFNYIPAIRTDQDALEIIGRMLLHELTYLESNEEYVAALETIRNLQQPILRSLADKIQEPLKEFMPTINKVDIKIGEDRRRTAFRREFEVTIDDGTPTRIEFKGDGVKSLAALALLKNRALPGSVPIIAIEEPESHLHPGAARQLNNIIAELSSDSQVIISTHNPVFINRDHIRSNIIIDSGKATPASSVSEIREVLGVRASDNLSNANLVLLVEGENDRIALTPILKRLSGKLRSAMSDRLLVIEPLQGAGNLPYQLSLFSSALCPVHVFLDNDDSAREAATRAVEDRQLKIAQITHVTCEGMTNSEFEDCINRDVYKADLLNEFGVDINSSHFRGREKWSDRMKRTFVGQGKQWHAGIAKQTKRIVAEAVCRNPTHAILESRRDSIDALIAAIERALSRAEES